MDAVNLGLQMRRRREVNVHELMQEDTHLRPREPLARRVPPIAQIPHAIDRLRDRLIIHDPRAQEHVLRARLRGRLHAAALAVLPVGCYLRHIWIGADDCRLPCAAVAGHVGAEGDVGEEGEDDAGVGDAGEEGRVGGVCGWGLLERGLEAGVERVEEVYDAGGAVAAACDLVVSACGYGVFDCGGL